MADKKIIGQQEKGVHFGCNLSQMLFWRGSGRSYRLVHWARYLNTKSRRSIFLSIVFFRKKQAGWLRKCLFKYSTKVRIVLENLEKPKYIASELRVCYTPSKPPGQNRRHLNHVVFCWSPLQILLLF